MVKRAYNGEIYVDSILCGKDKIKYNEKKKIGTHLNLLTSSGAYDLDYDLNMVECDFNKGFEGNITKTFHSSDNYMYTLSYENVVRKFTVDLEEVAIYRSDKKITSIYIDNKDNIYVCGEEHITKLNNNLEVIKSQHYGKFNEFNYLGNDEIFITTSNFTCNIVDANTLDITKQYKASAYLKKSYKDNEGNYYIFNNEKFVKLSQAFEFIKEININATNLYIKDDELLYAIDLVGVLTITKLNKNLEILASYDGTQTGIEFKTKDNFIFIYCNDGFKKFNENLEVVSELSIEYQSEVLVDDNFNIWTYSNNTETICVYNENFEKSKEIQFTEYVEDLYLLNGKLYIPVDTNIFVYDINLELVKKATFQDGVESLHECIGNLYILSYSYDLYKINENFEIIKSYEKTGNGYSEVLFDDGIYTINNDDTLRRYNNKLEEVGFIKLDLQYPYTAIIANDIYIQSGINKVLKINRNLSKVISYKHNVSIDGIEDIKHDNNIAIIDRNYNICILNKELEKIAAYQCEDGEGEYIIGKYIYYISQNSIVKLDKTLNVLARYNTGNVESILSSYKFVELNDEYIIVVCNDTELIKLNSNLEEVKRYVCDERISDIKKLEGNNILLIPDSYIYKKLNDNFEEIASIQLDYSTSSITNEFYYFFTYNKIIKTNLNLEVVKEIDSSSSRQKYVINNCVYVTDEFSLTKYNENLEKGNTLCGISTLSLIEVD